VKKLGGYAEVVSDMELILALKVGYPHALIIYNGPCKGPMMEEHILQGGISNIDNLAEAERVIQLARQYPDKCLKVGLRINSDIGANFISRFGLQIDTEGIQQVVDAIHAQPNLKLVGLHMHVSRARFLSAWQHRIDNILYAADKYIEGVPEYIDLGSGMFADMEDFLKNQFTIEVPTYQEYAKVVAGTMARHYASSSQKPMLFTEPGTTVVSRYLSLFTSVIGLKEIWGKRFAIVDTDYHQLGETGHMMRCPYTIFRNKTGGKSLEGPLDVVGYTCLEQDVLFKDMPEALTEGDVLQFRNIGGYSIVYKPPFIQPNCAMLALTEDGEVIEIKRKETFEDIFQTFNF
jgi:diaminopimelate decarboxylase